MAGSPRTAPARVDFYGDVAAALSEAPGKQFDDENVLLEAARQAMIGTGLS